MYERKKISIVMNTAVFSLIQYIEHVIFYKGVLCNVLTKRSFDIWTTFIIGSLIIAGVNSIVVQIFVNKGKLEHNSIKILIISSALTCLCMIILSMIYDKQLLNEIDYSHEISYLILCISSVFVTVWTIIINLAAALIKKFKS